MSQPEKTLQDYRNIVKILKIKALQLKSQNEYLQSQLGQGSASSAKKENYYSKRIDKLQHLRKDQFVQNMIAMNKLAESCERIGLAPEMLFRIADKKRSKQILAEDLRETLTRIKLNLDKVVIARILGIFNKTGSITHLQYHQVLAAFKVDTESPPWTSKLTYQQECLKALGTGLDIKNLTTIVNQISQSDQITYSQFFKYCVEKRKLNSTQAVALFNSMDKDQKCKLRKKVVIDTFAKLQNIPSDSKKEEEKKKDDGKSSKKPDPGKKKDDQFKKKQPKPEPTVKADLQQALKHFKDINLPIEAFFSQVVKQVSFKNPMVSLHNFITAATNIKGKSIVKVPLIQIFKLGDIQTKGSYTLSDLSNIYCRLKQPSQKIQPVLRSACVLLKSVKKLPVQHVQSLPYSDINESNVKAFLMLELNQSSIKTVMKEVQSSPNKLVKALQELGKFQEKDFLKFKKQIKGLQTQEDRAIKAIKPQILPADCLERLDRNDQGKKAFWNTIFHNQIAALRYCHDQFKKTRLNNLNKWLDPEFGPSDNDPAGELSIKVLAEDQNLRGIPNIQEIQWVTAQDMKNYYDEQVQATYRDKSFCFIDKDAKSSSIVQGSLGDCWFMSSLALIASNDFLIRGMFIDQPQKVKNVKQSESQLLKTGVFPSLFHIYKKLGIYCFKFLKDGQPKYVVVDQRLPKVKQAPQLLFAYNKGFYQSWVPLIEKAYAKLHHSYSSLVKGDISQGLSDLTNGLPIRLQFSGKKLKQKQEKDKFWNMMVNNFKGNNLIGCSAGSNNSNSEFVLDEEDNNTGIYAKHAYSIIDIFQIRDDKAENYHKSHRIIRVYNPHGKTEWQLKWSQYQESDEAKLWKFQKQIRAHYDQQARNARKQDRQPVQQYVFNKGTVQDDGSFLMCFKDWRNIFSNLFICKFPKENHTRITVSGKYGPESGFSKPQDMLKHPQYIIKLASKQQRNNLSIVLRQIDGRMFKGETHPFLQNGICYNHALYLLNLEPGESKCTKFSKQKVKQHSGGFKSYRSVEIQCIDIQNGSYALFLVPKQKAGGKQFKLEMLYQGSQQQISVSGEGSLKKQSGRAKSQPLKKQVLQYYKSFYEQNI